MEVRKAVTVQLVDPNGDKALSKNKIEKLYVAISPANAAMMVKPIIEMKAGDVVVDGKATLEELTAYDLAAF